MATKKKNRDCLNHTIGRDAWMQKNQAERISYEGKVPPRRVSWQTGEPYKCPELHHRSSGQAARQVTLNQR